MSINYYKQNLPKLHSPLLDGKSFPSPSPDQNQNKENKPTSKKTYYSPNEDNKDSTSEILNNTLFSKNDKNIPQKDLSLINDLINKNSITMLENIIKIASILIISTGGLFCILEFINILRTLISGSYHLGNSLTVLVAAIIGTVLANIICLGFSHLVKATKYIYLVCENQNTKIEKLTSHLGLEN